MSPFLFSLFLSDFEGFFRDRGLSGVSIDSLSDILTLLYCDDAVILSTSEIDMKRKLEVLEDYIDLNKLTVNLKKTKIMIFSRGGGSRGSENVFQFKNERVEISKKYVYLGASFTSSSLFGSMSDDTALKGKQATGVVRGIIAKSKLTSWPTKMSLYNSLILSVLLNNAQIWGLRYIEVLERVQVNFFKKLFLLPPNTPDSIVRLEFGVVHISLTIFKLTINWLIKLLSMKSSRYPLICFKRQLQLDHADPTYNWVQQVINVFFSKIDFSESFTSLSSAYLRKHKGDLLEKFKQVCIQRDLSFASTSAFPLFYSRVLNPDEPKNYLLFKCFSFKYLKFLAQVRTANCRFFRATFDGVSYSIDLTENCSICNSNVTQTFQHIFFECAPLRQGQISNDEVVFSVENFITFLNDILPHKVKPVVHYFLNILRLRSFIINE